VISNGKMQTHSYAIMLVLDKLIGFGLAMDSCSFFRISLGVEKNPQAVVWASHFRKRNYIGRTAVMYT